jgi:predicted SAM-dependent methyltransferase
MDRSNRKLYDFQDTLNGFLLWIKKNKRYKIKEGEVGLNLGCELETIPSFVGVDGSFLIYLLKNPFIPLKIKKAVYNRAWTSERHSFKQCMKKIKNLRIIPHEIRYGLPFRNNSVKYIFTSHFIEHLIEQDSLNLFKECFRVLKQKGKIRIIVPDLDESLNEIEKNIKNYKKTRNDKFLQGYLTDTKVSGSFACHRRMYNFEGLKNILEKSGFKNIKKMKQFKGNFPNLKELEIRGGLIVEAIKI